MSARGESDMLPLAELFRVAAAILSGNTAAEGPPRDLLLRLDYLDNASHQAPHRAAMLRAAALFKRIFTLEATDAPGLVALGAEVDPAVTGVRDAPIVSVSGTGMTFRQAFESCVGEGVEALSRYASNEDVIERLDADEALIGASAAVRSLWDDLLPYRRDRFERRTSWTFAADLADGHAVRLPADLCFRRPEDEREIDPPWPMSTGCGAGPDHQTATLHGLLEVIERDAVALWWRGGRRARVLRNDAGAAVLARLRGGDTSRRTWFLDITNDIGVPAVVAASCDDDGFGLCRGFAARTTLAGAADAAVREMAQMELAYRITVAKRSVRGDAALNDVDREHLRRYTRVHVAETPALHPSAPPLPPCDIPASDPLPALAEVRKRLAAVGVAPCAINLTRAAFGIPMVRVICPGLEHGMTAPPGARLRAAARGSGVDPGSIEPL